MRYSKIAKASNKQMNDRIQRKIYVASAYNSDIE